MRAEAHDFKCDTNHFSVVSRSPYEMSSCFVAELRHGNMKGGYVSDRTVLLQYLAATYNEGFGATSAKGLGFCT